MNPARGHCHTRNVLHRSHQKDWHRNNSNQSRLRTERILLLWSAVDAFAVPKMCVALQRRDRDRAAGAGMFSGTRADLHHATARAALSSIQQHATARAR